MWTMILGKGGGGSEDDTLPLGVSVKNIPSSPPLELITMKIIDNKPCVTYQL